MPVIFEKTGIFGFGKPIVRNLCDRCGEDVTNQKAFFNPNPPTSQFFCKKCAIHLKIPLQPHVWPTDSALFENSATWTQFWMKDTLDNQDKFIHSCHCGSLLIAYTKGKSTTRSYYSIGSRLPSSIEPKCRDINLEFSNDNASSNCTHDFIEVATSRVDESTGKKLLKQLKNSAANDILGPIDHEAAAFGRRYIWCSKCGLYYDLPKYREKELKRKGINKEWYI